MLGFSRLPVSFVYLQACYLSDAQQLLQAIAGVEGEVEAAQMEGRDQLSAQQQQLAIEKGEAEERHRVDEEQQVSKAVCEVWFTVRYELHALQIIEDKILQRFERSSSSSW